MERGEHKMAGQRGVNRDSRRFQVANFPNHYHVRRLAEDRAQCRRESEPDRFIDLHLVNARQQIFYGVLDRDDLAVRPAYEMQAGIKGCRLAGTGGPGNEQYAVWQTDQLLESLLVIGKKAEFRQT